MTSLSVCLYVWCCVRVHVFTDPAVMHASGGTDPGDTTPPLTKQRAYTESHSDSSHLDTPNSKYSTPIHGRPRPVPPKKNSVVAGIQKYNDGNYAN